MRNDKPPIAISHIRLNTNAQIKGQVKGLQ